MNSQKFLVYVLSIFCLTIAGCSEIKTSVADYRIIPLPQSIELTDSTNSFRLTDGTNVIYPAGYTALESTARIFSDNIEQLVGLKLKLNDTPASGKAIILHNNLTDSCLEAYHITICPDSIIVSGASDAGVFYGLQTLCKSITPAMGQFKTDVLFPTGEIYDYPIYSYRGVLLDASRHFFAPDSVKMFIDMIALHNVNHFHWHLTDDQGWRVEIKSHPELAEKGQWRSGTVVGAVKEGDEAHLNVYDSIPYGGYYTQAQVRDIVKYAADRHIIVIPEIDMPGHMQAALATYPELGCTGGPYEVWRRWGVSEDVLCAGNDSVYKFIDDVLEEIVSLFPGEYVHIGGDECPKVRWESCPKCQAKIKALGLTSDDHSSAEQKLQTYLMAHAVELLKRHDRKVIGWNEMLEGGLPDSAVVMSWTGIDGAVKAARLGHDAILTPCDYCYFDFVQANQSTEPQGAHWGHPITISDVYNFNPISTDLNEIELKHIIGVQANLWSEYIPTMSHAQYMTLPRLAALSEVQWCAQNNKSYSDFCKRLPSLIRHYKLFGYNYRYNPKDFSEL